MRYIILFFSCLLVPFLGQAQSFLISESASTQSHSTKQFLIAGHKVGLENSSLAFASGAESSGINSLTAISTALDENGVTLYEGDGVKLRTSSYNIAEDDESVKVYPMPSGGFVIRENDVNFLFFDAFGNVKQSISNASGSTEGEATSELASDPAFKTVVLYNPKVILNGLEGSRAKIIKPNGATLDIFYSSDRAIRTVDVSEDGQYLAVISYKAGTDDEVTVVDRFGNKVNSFTFNQTVVKAKFSTDGRYITVRSNGRIGVYSLIDGERIGSTSFRSSLYFADYIPEDKTILAMTGERSGLEISDIEFHAIDLSARTIERKKYNASLGMSDLIDLTLKRKGPLNYTLEGLNKVLELKIQF